MFFCIQQAFRDGRDLAAAAHQQQVRSATTRGPIRSPAATKHAKRRVDQVVLGGHQYDIAVGQVDVGNTRVRKLAARRRGSSARDLPDWWWPRSRAASRSLPPIASRPPSNSRSALEQGITGKMAIADILGASHAEMMGPTRTPMPMPVPTATSTAIAAAPSAQAAAPSGMASAVRPTPTPVAQPAPVPSGPRRSRRASTEWRGANASAACGRWHHRRACARRISQLRGCSWSRSSWELRCSPSSRCPPANRRVRPRRLHPRPALQRLLRRRLNRRPRQPHHHQQPLPARRACGACAGARHTGSGGLSAWPRHRRYACARTRRHRLTPADVRAHPRRCRRCPHLRQSAPAPAPPTTPAAADAAANISATSGCSCSTDSVVAKKSCSDSSRAR